MRKFFFSCSSVSSICMQEIRKLRVVRWPMGMWSVSHTLALPKQEQFLMNCHHDRNWNQLAHVLTDLNLLWFWPHLRIKKMLLDKSTNPTSKSKPRVSKKTTNNAGCTKWRKKAVKEVDETPCCICQRKYNEPLFEPWSACSLRGNWYHDSCGPDDEQVCYNCVA